MNKVTVTLRDPFDKSKTLDYFINVYDTPMGNLWYTALQDVLQRNLYLEKNFCFLGFPDSQRDLEYICTELTWARNQINTDVNPLKLFVLYSQIDEITYVFSDPIHSY